MKQRERADRPWFPLAAVTLGHILWGFSVLFSKVALQAAPPEVLLSVRFLVAAFIMVVLFLMDRSRVSFRGKHPKPLILLVVSELVYFYFESYGILYTNATFAGVVLAVVPVVAIGTAIVCLREFPTRRQAGFCLLPVAGVVMMTVSGSSLGIIRPLGVAFLMGACLSSAAYKTANRKSAEEFTPFERTFVVILSCAVVFTLSAVRAVHGDMSIYLKPLSQPSFLMSVLALSLFCSVGCNILVNYAAGRMSVVTLSSFGSLTTLCSMVAGVLFLREPLTPGLLIGSVLILVGIRQVVKDK